MNKSIRLSGHASMTAQVRGATASEVEAAIRSEQWETAKQNRLECRKNFEYNAEWNGRRYAVKQVRPIFVDEDEEIVVITVYVYYF